MSPDIRIALLGYGRMGKELHAIILDRGWPEPVLIDPHHPLAHSSPQTAPLDAVDVCIDFTEPSEAHNAIVYMLSSGIPVVSGTTGWQHGADSVKAAVHANSTAFLHANNFSVGVHLLTSIVQYAASLFRQFPQYDIALHETHHRLKKDIPSGTATLLAQRILEAHPGKTRSGPLEIGKSIDPDMLSISASRVGTVFGTHSVLIDSETDTIELKHTAKGRLGFAEGALAAAEWIIGKEGYFTLEDMIHDITST